MDDEKHALISREMPEWMEADLLKMKRRSGPFKGPSDPSKNAIGPEDISWIDTDKKWNEEDRFDPTITLKKFFEMPILEVLVASIIDAHPQTTKSTNDRKGRDKRVKAAMEALVGLPAATGKNEVEEDEILENLVFYINWRKAGEDKSSVESMVEDFLRTLPEFDGSCLFDDSSFEATVQRLIKKLRKKKHAIAAARTLREDYKLREMIYDLMNTLKELGVSLAPNFESLGQQQAC